MNDNNVVLVPPQMTVDEAVLVAQKIFQPHSWTTLSFDPSVQVEQKEDEDESRVLRFSLLPPLLSNELPVFESPWQRQKHFNIDEAYVDRGPRGKWMLLFCALRLSDSKLLSTNDLQRCWKNLCHGVRCGSLPKCAAHATATSFELFADWRDHMDVRNALESNLPDDVIIVVPIEFVNAEDVVLAKV